MERQSLIYIHSTQRVHRPTNVKWEQTPPCKRWMDCSFFCSVPFSTITASPSTPLFTTISRSWYLLLLLLYRGQNWLHRQNKNHPRKRVPPTHPPNRKPRDHCTLLWKLGGLPGATALEASKNSWTTIVPVPTSCRKTPTRFGTTIGPAGTTFWESPWNSNKPGRSPGKRFDRVRHTRFPRRSNIWNWSNKRSLTMEILPVGCPIDQISSTKPRDGSPGMISYSHNHSNKNLE